MAYIRIIGVPAGEAPHSIRCAWVGCVLPLHPSCNAYPELYLGEGVISGARKTLLTRLFVPVKQTAGYAVLASEAIEALSLHNPVAAQWWYENTPHLIDKGGTLVFEASVCQKLADD